MHSELTQMFDENQRLNRSTNIVRACPACTSGAARRRFRPSVAVTVREA